MTQEQSEFYQRIERFRFDQGSPAFPFAMRVARENGWSWGYTARVITEYRRFVFLAMEAGHPVTPSDQVDQVWHLHLLYTRNYWGPFQELLGRPLHHGPTEGGEAEKEKFHDWYGRTQESYRAFFESDAPRDIWPEPKVRFGEDILWRRVNVARNWVLPKWLGFAGGSHV